METNGNYLELFSLAFILAATIAATIALAAAAVVLLMFIKEMLE